MWQIISLIIAFIGFTASCIYLYSDYKNKNKK